MWMQQATVSQWFSNLYKLQMSRIQYLEFHLKSEQKLFTLQIIYFISIHLPGGNKNMLRNGYFDENSFQITSCDT